MGHSFPPFSNSHSQPIPVFFDRKLNEFCSFIYYCANVVVMDMRGAHLDGRQVSGLQDGEHLSSVHREGTETLTPVSNYRFSFFSFCFAYINFVCKFTFAACTHFYQYRKFFFLIFSPLPEYFTHFFICRPLLLIAHL